MKKLTILGIIVCVGLLLVPAISGAAGPPGGLDVNIVNPLPVPVTGDVNASVSGDVNITAGPEEGLDVNIVNPLPVPVTGDVNASVSGDVNVSGGVAVTNTESDPIPVRDVDTYDCTREYATYQGIYNGMGVINVTPVVLENMIFVIETYSFHIYLGAGGEFFDVSLNIVDHDTGSYKGTFYINVPASALPESVYSDTQSSSIKLTEGNVLRLITNTHYGSEEDQVRTSWTIQGYLTSSTCPWL